MSYTHSLPKERVTHVTAICGKRGEEWLDSLPSTIGELEKRWSLKVREPFEAGEFNFVAPASRGSELTVLKISPPYKTIEIFGEAEYLRIRNGNGAVKLLDEDRSRKAILIEHALPGKNLTEIFAHDKAASVETAILVLRNVILPPPTDARRITTLDSWFDGLWKYQSTRFPADYAEKALAIYKKLSADRNRTFYLHGDFHPGNVVSATRAPFLAIDPKGILGHIGYEIAVFLNNLHWWQETEPDVRDLLATAVTQFSEAFDVDPTELRQWAYAQMVLGAWWSFEDMPEYYDESVAKADIWDV